MMIYGTTSKISAIARYSEIETGMLLLTATDAMLKANYRDLKNFAATIARIFVTKGDLRILIDEGSTEGMTPGTEMKLRLAPADVQRRIKGLLDFFIPVGIAIDQANVLVSADKPR